MSSNSKLLDVSTERLHNSFITAILPNGVLHRAFLARHPFNAVFVPSEARLQDLGLSDLLSTSTTISEDAGSNNNEDVEVRGGGGDNDNGNSSLSSKELAELFISHTAVPNARLRTFLASLLDNHLARFDDFGLGEAFTLCNGIRGAVSDGLDKLSISGRLSRIPIASHTPPSTKLGSNNNEEAKNGNAIIGPFSSVALLEAGGGGYRGSSACRLAHLNCLNIFFLADCVIESYDVKRVMLMTATNASTSATHRSSGPDQAHHHLLGSSPLLRGSSSFGTQNTEEDTIAEDGGRNNNGNAIPELQVSTKPARGISKILDGLMTSWRGGGGGGGEETAAVPIKSASEYTDEHGSGSSSQQQQKDAAVVPAQKPITPSPQKSDPQANFKDFQSIMQKPQSKHLTRCLTAFVDYCNNATCVSATRTSSLGSNGSLGGGAVAPAAIIPGASPANKPVSANEVRSVIDQLMKIIFTMQQNGEEGGKLWKGKEEEVALEGFEKYILTKIYNRTYAFYPKEREEGTALHLRIAALRSVVSEQTFEIVAPVKFKAKIDTATILSPTEMGKLVPREGAGLCSTTTHWAKAIEELRAMSTYKCPRDKLMCGINACRLVVKALDVVSLQVQQEKKRLQDLEKELRHDPPPAPRTLNPSSIVNSDEEEDNNEDESDDSAKMAAPQRASADTFLPAMFLLVSRANPLGYLSSMRFVDRYRHRTFLNGDAGYLLTCLLSAIDFWQNCGHEELGISSEVFEKALSTLPKEEEDKTTTVLTATNGLHPTSSKPKQQQQSLPVSSTTPTTTYTASPIVAAAAPSASCLAGVETALNCRIPSPPLSSSNNNNRNTKQQQQHMDPFDAFFDGGVAAAAAPTRGDNTTTSNNTSETAIAAATVISTPATRPPREDSGSYRQQHEAYPEYDPSTANSQQQAPAHRSAYPPTPGQIASPVNHHQSTSSTVVLAQPVVAVNQSPAVPPSLQGDITNGGDALVKRAITKMNGREGFDSLSVAELRALAEEALRLRQLLDLD